MAENKDLKLPSRSYWEGFKARNEVLWDKIKNNTFVNMMFPIKEVSEGNTTAMLPLIVPGGQAIKTISEPLYVYSAKKLGLKVGRGRPASNINELTNNPITMDDILSAIKNNNRVRYEGIKSEQEVQSLAKRLETEKKANFRSIVLKQDKQDALNKDLWDRRRGNYTKRLNPKVIGTGPELTSQINVENYYSYKPGISPEANLRKFKEKMSPNFSFTDKSIEEIFNTNYSKYFNIRRQGGSMNYIEYCKNGSGIHIKKANRGKFTDYCGGKVTSECIARGKHSPSATIRKRATFAANARTWKHQSGGRVYFNVKDNYNEGLNIEDPRKEQESVKQQEQTSLKEQESQTLDWISNLVSNLSSTSETSETNESQSQLLSKESSKSVQTSGSQSDRMKAAINYLIGKGLTKEGAAGVAGVLFAESGLNPGIVNEAEDRKYRGRVGKGIAQWSNERRKSYEEYMKDKSGSLEDELDYLYQELETQRPKVLEVLRSTSDLNDAVKAMHLGYENGSTTVFATPELLIATYTPAWLKLGYGPYNYQDSHNKRYRYALTAYNLV